MSYLRLILLMALLGFGTHANDHAREVIRNTPAVRTLTQQDSTYLAEVWTAVYEHPFSILVQNETVVGTGHDHTEEVFDLTSHSETDAILNARNRTGQAPLKDAVLYTFRQPCGICLSILGRSGISTVYYTSGRCDKAIYSVSVPGSQVAL